MTREQFRTTNWFSGAKVNFGGKAYEVGSVDFSGQDLIGILQEISGAEEGHITWVRCEDCEIVILDYPAFDCEARE